MLAIRSSVFTNIKGRILRDKLTVAQLTQKLSAFLPIPKFLLNDALSNSNHAKTKDRIMGE